MANSCWHVGHNLAGYLPESDVQCYLTREAAVVGLKNDAKSYADDDDEQNDASLPDAYGTEDDVPYDAYGSMRATVDSILKDDGPDASSFACSDYAISVSDHGDRRVEFWLKRVASADCDHAGCDHDDE